MVFSLYLALPLLETYALIIVLRKLSTKNQFPTSINGAISDLTVIYRCNKVFACVKSGHFQRFAGLQKQQSSK